MKEEQAMKSMVMDGDCWVHTKGSTIFNVGVGEIEVTFDIEKEIENLRKEHDIAGSSILGMNHKYKRDEQR
jgi:hypothetical protein